MNTQIVPEALHLHANGLSIVLDTSSGCIPRVAYWGRELEDATEADLQAIIVGSREALDGNAPDIVLRTGLVPLESDGWSGRPGLRGFRDGGAAWAPRFTLEDVSPPVENFDLGLTPVTFTLVDPVSELGLELTVEMIPQGMARAQAKLTNRGNSPYHLEELGIAFPVPLEADEILDMTGRWGKERHPQRRPVVQGCDLRELHHGRTGFNAPGFTFVGSEGFSFQEGEVWGLHTAFSGNHRAWVEKVIGGEEHIGGSELLMPGEVTLQAGESYATPWIYVVHSIGLDDAANRLRRWYRAREHHVGTNRPVSLNVWEAVYFDHDLDELKGLADVASDIGVERFVLDDGWFKGRNDDWAGLGDWFEDEKKWPNGLGPLAEYVHGKGMQFGLWFEPEMVNPDSDLARSHPDWIMAAQGSSSAAKDLPLPWRHQQVLNISIPEARKYIEDRVVEVVQRVGVDYIKWDHNRDLIEAGDLTQEGKAATSAQTRAYYRLVDDIKSRCPGLEIESCASGGGRIDLEVLQHTDRVWVSDCIDPVERQEMVRWTYQVVPPEMMGTHVASPWSHTTGRWSPMSLRGATAIWGHFGIEWDIASADPDEVEQLRQWIEFYKREREFLLTGDLIRCETPDPSLWLQGNVSPNREKALFSLFTESRSAVAPRGRLRFPGLNQQSRYRVRPVLVGKAPSGLVAPPWFGVERRDTDSTNQSTFDVDQDIPGIVMTGQALEFAGLQTPRIHPDQLLLIQFEEVNN